MQRMIREVDPPRPSTRLSRLDSRGTIATTRSTDPERLRRTLSGELDWIVMKCLEKDRVRRYETASALAADVSHYLADEPVTAGPTSAAYLARKFVHRHRAAVAAALAAVVIAVVVTGLYIRGIRAEQAKTRAALAEAQAQRKEAESRRAEAEQANENAQAVNDFLTRDVLGAADPALTQGRSVTVKEALDNAAKSVDENFKDRPLIEASVRDSLAKTYDALGATDVALPHAKAALDIRTKLLGPDHPDTLATATMYALLLHYQGKFDEAQSLYLDAIDRSRRTLGADHPDTLRLMFNLASLLAERGKYADAEKMFRQVLDGRRRVLGDDHPDTAATLNHLAGSVANQGRLAEAEPLYRDALAKKRRALGELHPSTLVSINDLAIVLAKEGKDAEAEPLYREALDKYRQVLGADHPSTIIASGNYADFLLRVGKLDNAEKLLRDAAERSKRTDSTYTSIAMANLCELLTSRGQLTEAESLGREALDRTRRAYGPEHTFTMTVSTLLINCLLKEKKFADAEPILVELHRVALRGTSGNTKFDAEHACKYGVVLADQERWAEAEPRLNEGIERLKSAGMERSPERRDVLTRFAKLSRATYRAERAEAVEKEMASIPPATRPATRRAGAPTTTTTSSTR
jgi:tetratricopeptide (TPR) repeat protein